MIPTWGLPLSTVWLTGLFLLGLLIGNLLIKPVVYWTAGESARLPLRCTGCGTEWRWFHWLPLLRLNLWPGSCPNCGRRAGFWMLSLPWLTGLLFAGFGWCFWNLQAQQTPEVLPPQHLWAVRFGFQMVLLTLLILATGTDLRDYVIPDQVTITGMVLGIGLATVCSELQIVHIWVDWNDEIPGIRGPFLPEWIKHHPHLHGLAWSMAGLLVGAGITWLARWLSWLILGQEALGFGDVTLMAMIGSFLGWQPVLFVFLLAPLAGIVAALLTPLFLRRTFLPYGPYLSVAAMAVLCSWRWLWMLELPISAGSTFSVRHFFGDWVSLLWLGGISLTAFVVLLCLLRGYRMIPVTLHARPAPELPPAEPISENLPPADSLPAEEHVDGASVELQSESAGELPPGESGGQT